MFRGLAALSKGEALLAAFLWESRALPSAFALQSALICQQQQRILAPRCCFTDGERGRAASPQPLLKAALAKLHRGETLPLCDLLVSYSGEPSTSAGQSTVSSLE